MSEPGDRARESVLRSDAIVAMAVGAAVIGLCGLCTYSVSAHGGAYGLEYFVGGIPILAGAFVFIRGYLQFARSRHKQSGKPDDH